jgi:hypothetical protein
MNLRVDDGVIFAGDVEDRLEDLVGPQWELQTVHAVHVCRDQPKTQCAYLNKEFSKYIFSSRFLLLIYSLPGHQVSIFNCKSTIAAITACGSQYCPRFFSGSTGCREDLVDPVH